MKRFLFLFFASLLSLTTWAYDFEKDGLCYKITSEDDLTCSVTYTGTSKSTATTYSGDIVIPRTVEYENNTYLVTGIDEYAFYNGKENIMSITFETPSNVASIGDRAFYTCSALTQLELPEGITEIPTYALYSCSGLTSFTIPQSVTYIGTYAFQGCNGLTTIAFPEALTEIGQNAFYLCKGLETIEFAENGNLTTTGQKVFQECSALKEVSLPASLSTLGNYAFYKCSSLEKVTFPENGALTSTGTYTFYDCDNLSTITIPSYITEIGNYFLYSCEALETVNFAENSKLTTLGTYLFQSCAKLNNVELPDGVTAIGNYDFKDCTGLEKITLGSKIETVGQQSFYGCTALSSLTVKSSVPPTVSNTNAFTNVPTSTCVLYVPTQSVDLYKEHNRWSVFSNIEGFGYTFSALTYDATDVTNSGATLNAVITAGDETITEQGFEWWLTSDNVQKVIDSVIEEDMSLSISGLTKSTTYTYRAYAIANDVTTYGEEYTLTTGSYDFEDAGIYYLYGTEEGTCEVTWGGATKTSGTDAYMGNIEVPEKATYENVDYIVVGVGEYAFYNSTSSPIITLPATVTSIGQYAFRGCSNLTEINIPEGVTVLNNYTFYNCTSLPKASIPSSVTSLGTYVFNNCSAMTELYCYAENPPTVTNTNAFGGSFSKTNCTLYVPKGTSEDYAEATGWKDFTNIEEISSEDEGTPLEKWAKFEVDGVYYQVTDSDNREVEVTSEEEPWDDFGSYTGDITIPATVTYENVEYTVVGVGEAAFWYSEKLTSVSLPSSLTYFGEYAFNACFLLKEITIPAALTTLSEAAISECYALETIKVEEGNTSFCVEDGVLYTMDKTSLIQYPVAVSATSFVIPEEVEYVEVSAFAGSQNLTEVTIASTVTYIKLDAFWYCENLLTVYSLATTPPEMDNVIFYTSGPNWANSVLYVPAGCVDLYKAAKVWNSFGTIKEIGDEPLEDGDTFDYNGIIYKVVSAEDKTVEVTYYGDSYSDDEAVAYYTGDITIPASFEYQGATYTVIGVGDYAFYKSGVLSISFDTPSNVTYLGTRAMYNCTAITELELPEGVLTVGDQSLRQCTSMTTLKLPETVTYLGEYLCWGNTALKAINIPSSVTTLGKYVFYNCSAATELTLSPNITDWGGHAFYDCEALTHVDIPEGITEVGEYAFSNCDGLVSVSIPDEVTTLGGHTFAACSKLESCVLPESMTEVDGYLFYNCPALTEVTIGSNVESFGSNVFAGCPALAAVYSLNPVPPTINSNTFSSTSLNGATDKETCVLYVPCGSEEDYASADYWSAFANIVGYDCPEVQTFDYTLDPAEGEVSSLHNISISYDDGVKLNVSESKWGNAKVYDANGDEVVEVIIATPIGTYGQTYTGYNFTLGLDGSSQDVTEAGDYYFVIPEGYISFYDSANDTWVECEQIIAHYVIEGDGDKGGTEAPYTVEPAEGIVESLSYVKFIDEGAICYTEEVDPSEVKVYKDGDISSAVAYGVSVEDDYTSGSWDDAVKVTFNTTLTVAGEYTVVVPEGLFNIGSWTVVNDEITLNYIVDGSADTGTFVCDVDPADGAKVTKLDQIIFTNPSGGEIFVNEEIWNPEINVYDEGGVLITQVTNFYTDFGDNWEELAQIAMFGGSDDEGNVYPSEITAEGTYYVSVPANVFFIYDEGGNVCYNESMSLTYIVSADAGTENPDYTLSFSPEDGSTLDVLSTITISCEDGITQVLMPDEEITITDDSGNTWSGNYTITEVANDLGIVTQVVISLNPEIAEAGTYYVNVPWGYFDINQHMNEAFTLTYTITGTYTGISGISINDENVEGIYSVGGQKLNATQKGVNIIRFSDGGVKKLYVK